jgi:hypothetical protein
MAEEISNQPEENSLEDIAYETRLLLNVVLDLLTEKKIITEDEVFKRYDETLSEAEAELDKDSAPGA